MALLNYLAWACFVLAGLSVIMAMGEGLPVLIAGAISLAISGVLFLALNKIILSLIEIRDAIRGEKSGQLATSHTNTPNVSNDLNDEVSSPEMNAPTKSLAELSADLERLKKGRSS